MQADYCRPRHSPRKQQPDLSRFYTRQALKYYRRFVLPRSRFLRLFNWMIEPTIRRMVPRTSKSFMQKWAGYRP